MRKYLLSFLGFLLLFSLLFLKPSWAQDPDPFGYNIVNNFYTQNPDGTVAFNDQAFRLLANGTVTVRLISGELELYPNLITDIQNAAHANNLQIIWQPEDWHATTALEFETIWLPYLAQINTGTISLFTEYNYFYGNPQEYARILELALGAGFSVPIATTNFNITNPTGGISPAGGTMMQYYEFLEQVQAECGCLDQIPVWSVSIYGLYSGTNVNQAAESFIAQLEDFSNKLASLGVNLSGKTIIIPEAGLDPSKPIEERLNMARAFIEALENNSRLSSFPFEVGAITFLFMDDKTGKQYFLYKDENGEWQVAEYGDFGLIGFSGPLWAASRRIGSAYGKSFIVEKTVCWGDYGEAVGAVIRGLKTQISDNQPVADSLEEVNVNLLPPGVENESEGKKTIGNIEFEACALNTQNYYPVEDSIKIEVPETYQRSSTNAVQMGGFLSPPGSRLNSLTRLQASSNQNKNYIAQKLSAPEIINQPAVLAESTSCPNIGFSAGGEGGRLCWTITGPPGDLSYCDWSYEITVNGQVVAGVSTITAPACLIKPEGLNITCRDGGAAPVAFSGTAQVGLNITNVRGPGSYDCRLDWGREISCTAQADGEIVCTDAFGNIIPKPTSPPCLPRDNTGKLIAYKDIANSGVARIPIGHGLSPERFWEIIGEGLGVCKRIEFVFTPLTNVPYTFPDEGIQRGFYQLSSLPGDEENFLFTHSETQENIFGVQASPEDQVQTDLDIYGQKGVKSAYDYTKQLLTPPGW